MVAFDHVCYPYGVKISSVDHSFMFAALMDEQTAATIEWKKKKKKNKKKFLINWCYKKFSIYLYI